MTAAESQPTPVKRAGVGRIITVQVVVDVVQVLGHDQLAGNIYLLDNNALRGSRFEGTQRLHTWVDVGDRLVWAALPLEVETFVQIARISIDPEYVELERATYPDTDVVYWTGIVKRAPARLPYALTFKIGTRAEPMTSERTMALIGGRHADQ